MNELPVVLHDKPEPALHAHVFSAINQPVFDSFRTLALLVSEMPLALISLRGKNGRLVHADIKPPLAPAGSFHLLCEHCLMEGEAVEITDLSRDSDFAGKELMAGEQAVSYYAGFPLVTADGHVIGVLSLLDYVPNRLPENKQRATRLLAAQLVRAIMEINQKEESKHLDRLLDVSKDLICTVGHDGYFIKINTAFGSVLGWEEAYLLRTSLFDLVHRDDIVGTLKAVARLTSGNSITKFTHRIRTRSGDYKFLQWVASPEPATGTFFAVARDITEEKEKEKKLRISESNLKSFFENSQGLMCTHDLEGRFISVNRAGAATIGYEVEELLCMSLYNIIPKEYHASLTYQLKQLTVAGKSTGIMRTRHKNGSTKIWMYNNVLEQATAGNLYVIGNAIDITERHLLEKTLNRTKEMLEQTNLMARIGGWEYDLAKQHMYWSPITRLIHEVEPDFVPDIENGLFFYKAGESRDKINQAVTIAIQKGQPWDMELQITTARGREIWVRAQGSAEFEHDNCRRIYGTFQDITESVIQREELRHAKQLAEKASMAKSEFLANMSHEIRTPLNGVIGFTDLVLKTKLTDTQRQYLAIVHQSGNALLNIINDILDFSKIEAGKLELDISKCDLYALASQATDIISYQAQNKQLEILLNISPGMPRFIWTDSIRLKQVLINLLSNAIKFTDKGEIELKVETFPADADGMASLRFEVRDTGIGIPLDKQQKIFEAFLQEDPSITRKYGGTGLGLTISNKLLALMGSRMQVESLTGHGSKFYFELTVKTEHGEAHSWSSFDAIQRVLVVDDNDNNRVILQQMLLLEQIESDEAQNGFEALNLLARGTRYDAIIVDYHMPYMDGIQTIRKIRKNFPDPAQKIILLHSSSDDEQIMQASDELNITSRLAKPIKMQEMYEHLFHSFRKDNTLTLQPTGTAEASLPSQPITVLITEDNGANMMLAKTIIRRIAPHARIVEALNGLEAVKRFQTEKPDIIFMDIQMPEMNGWEAAAKIRTLEADKHTPIIALTASNVKGEREKCLAAGMDDFLSKPFAEEDLVQQFARWTHVQVSTSRQVDSRQVDPPAEEKASVYFDLQQVINYLDGDTGFLVEFLDITQKELEASRLELQTAARAHNLPALNAAAHKLKGTALITGMEKLSNLAKALEKLAEFHESVVNDLLADVQQEIILAVRHIERSKGSL